MATMKQRSPIQRLMLLTLVCCIFLPQQSFVNALQNIFPQGVQFVNPFASIIKTTAADASSSSKALEDELLQTIRELGDENRLVNSEKIQSIVEKLEKTPSISQPAISPSIYGTWRLIQTTNADTASPIQRKAVDTTKFNIYQNIFVRETNNNDDDRLIVRQSVVFNREKRWLLNVDALASTAAYPLPELTERKGDGKILGLNVLGVSLVGEEAAPDESRPNSRIDFVFDEGNFELGDSIKVPYPVPFRLPILRDAVKGWIDITYLSETLRISRGNKGTTFILIKEDD